MIKKKRVDDLIEKIKSKNKKAEMAMAEYSGSGDSGEITQIWISPGGDDVGDLLEQAISDLAYDVLEAKQPGWEINEGSEGVVTIDIKTGKLTLSHAVLQPVYSDDEEIELG